MPEFKEYFTVQSKSVSICGKSSKGLITLREDLKKISWAMFPSDIISCYVRLNINRKRNEKIIVVNRCVCGNPLQSLDVVVLFPGFWISHYMFGP